MSRQKIKKAPISFVKKIKSQSEYARKKFKLENQKETIHNESHLMEG